MKTLVRAGGEEPLVKKGVDQILKQRGPVKSFPVKSGLERTQE